MHADSLGRMISVVAAGVTALAGAADGQPNLPEPPAERDIGPPDNPFLEYGEPQEYSVVAQINLLACGANGQRRIFGRGFLGQTQVWRLRGGEVLFPFADVTSNSAPMTPAFAAEFFADGDRLPVQRRVVGLDRAAAPYVEVTFPALAASNIRVRVEYLRRAWNTTFLEEKARAVGYPSGEYPPEAAGTFRAEYGIPYAPDADPSENPAKALIAEWTGGKDPRNFLGPVLLAKGLTKLVIDRISLSGDGALQIGAIGGDVSSNIFVDSGDEPLSQTAAWDTILSGRGTDIDLVLTLTALLREAGIAARLVVGVRDFETEGVSVRPQVEERDFITAWSEFFLLDEGSGESGWIPIDIIRQREESSRAPAIEKPYRFFGNHDEFELYVPLGHHVHPPTNTAWYGPPALYGWNPSPAVPDCGTHAVEATVQEPSNRGGTLVFSIGR